MPAVATHARSTRCPSCRRLHASSEDWKAFSDSNTSEDACERNDCAWGADRCWEQDCGIPADGVATIAARARTLRGRRPWRQVPHMRTQ